MDAWKNTLDLITVQSYCLKEYREVTLELLADKSRPDYLYQSLYWIKTATLRSWRQIFRSTNSFYQSDAC